MPPKRHEDGGHGASSSGATEMAAAPLIAMGEDGRMSVPEGTVEMLGEIDDPVAIIAVAGPYRSGKSFLMNCLSQVSPWRLLVAAKLSAVAERRLSAAICIQPVARGRWALCRERARFVRVCVDAVSCWLPVVGGGGGRRDVEHC